MRVIIAAGKFKGDGRAYANRFAQRDDTLRLLGAGNHIAAHARRLFGEPAQERRGVVDLAAGFGQRLAFLECNKRCEVFAVLDRQLVPASQHIGAMLGGRPSPLAEGFLRGVDSTSHLEFAAAWQFDERRLVDRIAQGIAAVRRLADPLAGDEGACSPQGGVFQEMFHRRRSLSRENGPP